MYKVQSETLTTGDQHRFAQLIGDYPSLSGHFDFETQEIDWEKLHNGANVLTSNEEIMAKFFAGVWCGEDSMCFDFFKAARLLPKKEFDTIRNWAEAPFWIAGSIEI